jgi:uncharacterized protein YbaP (TraB family)
MRRTLVAFAACLLSLHGFAGLAGCKKNEKTEHEPATASGADPWAGADVASAGTSKVIEKPLLWKMEKDGKTSWLFGTIHLGVNADTQLPQVVFDRINDAKTFVMEADTTDPALAMAMRRTDGGSLRNDLGPEYWKKLEDALGARVANNLDSMKPFGAMTVLVARDLPMTPPMDRVLADRATKAGKPIHYLELAIDQIAMIEPWMAPNDVKALLDNRELAKKQALEMMEAYRAGDAERLGTMFDDQTLWLAAGRKAELFPAYLDAILGKRNRAWVPQLEQLHEDGGAFVAVGAGHLVGPGNVIGLLTEKGYTITRVTPGGGGAP